MLAARKKGDEGSSEWQGAEDAFPERAYYERLCRREGSSVVSEACCDEHGEWGIL